jgi:hypothetical protein
MALVPGWAIVVHRRRRRHRPAYTGWEARHVRGDQVEENDSLGVELRECLADPEVQRLRHFLTLPHPQHDTITLEDCRSPCPIPPAAPVGRLRPWARTPSMC